MFAVRRTAQEAAVYPESKLEPKAVETFAISPFRFDSSGVFVLTESEQEVWYGHEEFDDRRRGDFVAVLDDRDGVVHLREVVWGPRGGRRVQSITLTLDAWDQIVEEVDVARAEAALNADRTAVAEARKAGA
jgi:hypothetical protein